MMQITINIPPNLEQALRETEQSPEEYILRLLTKTLIPADTSSIEEQQPLSDPLFDLAGCITSDRTDIAENHDRYLGQSIQAEMHRSE